MVLPLSFAYFAMKRIEKPQIPQTCALIAHPYAPHAQKSRRRLTANIIFV